MRILRRGRRRPPVRDFLGEARAESLGLGHDYVGSEHVLLAVAGRGDDRVATALRRLGVTAEDVRADILLLVGRGPARPGSRLDRDALASLGIDLDEVRRRLEATFGDGALERTAFGCTPVCPRAKQALERASDHAQGPLVTDADVLVGLISVEDSLAAQILAGRGITPDRLREALVA
jgi:ATP-dependent Clp protease ATP-binding subunit ClpA